MGGATTSFSVEAYSFESSFSLRQRPPWLPRDVACTIDKTLLKAKLGDDASLFAFDFGALVFVNVERSRIDAILAEISKHLTREPHPPLREDFTLRVDPAKQAPDVTFDSVVVPELSPSRLECVATVLAQSVTIDYYEEDLQQILRRVQEIASDIAKAGRLRTRRRPLIRFVARSIASQAEMIGSIALLDKPDFTWEDEAAERLYDVLRHHLEIAERYRALEKKLETIRESLSQFLEINAASRAFFLEALVVLLIVIEVVVSLVELTSHR